MPKRRETPQYVTPGEKDYWHPYNLQALPTTRFIGVVGKILTGKYRLLAPRTHKQVPSL